MTRQEFESLKGKQKAEFINKELECKTLGEIAHDEFGMSESWVFKILGRDGYSKKKNGKFFYDETKHLNQKKLEQRDCINGEFEELLKHKDTLIQLV